jgi:hypothetical protein
MVASKPIDDSTLKALCEAKLNNALGWLGGRLSKDRQLAQAYYRGDLFGNEQEGRSKVISRDVAEAIDGVMPGLLKPFISSDTVVTCMARRPDQDAAAKQATDYLNWVFQNQPNAFNLLYTWQKSGLMNKIGVVKSFWDEQQEVVPEDYEGLTLNQLFTLLSDENVELVSIDAHPAPQQPIDPSVQSPQAQAPQATPPGALPQTPANMPGGVVPPPQVANSPVPLVEGMLYDCSIKRTNKTGRIAIMAIPPEEFLTDRRATSLTEATFTAHRARKTVSDLIEMGYPKKQCMDLPAADDLDFNQETVTRFKPEDEEPRRDADNLDPAMRNVWYAECYLKVDYDGDGVAEWRKVCLAGGGAYEILDNEPCEGHPFSAWCPYPQPHKLFGESMADKTMDLQLIKSTVWRQTLDGLYFNNAPQLVVLEGQANLEDVLTRRPGGVIRVKSPNAVEALASQDVSGSGFQMISYLDSVKETRTGVRRFTAGIEADALNPYASTATGAGMVEDASQDQIMLLARTFAEQGLVPLFQRMLELICKYQDKAQTVRLRGEWVDIDPSTWSTQMDMTVAVGLGTGNRSQQIAQLMAMITQVDAPIVQAQGGLNGPLVTAENAYKKLNKLTEAMGFKTSDNFYTDPASIPPQPPQQPPPDPNMVLAQAQIQAVRDQNAGRLQIQREKMAGDQQLQREQAAFDAQLAILNAQLKAALQQYQAALDANNEHASLHAKARVDMLVKAIEALGNHHMVAAQ